MSPPKKYDLNQKRYQTGYWGVWSERSKQFVFGVQKESRKDVLQYIRKKTKRPVRYTHFRVKGISDDRADDFWQPLKWRDEFVEYKRVNERFRNAKRIGAKRNEEQRGSREISQ